MILNMACNSCMLLTPLLRYPWSYQGEKWGKKFIKKSQVSVSVTEKTGSNSWEKLQYYLRGEGFDGLFSGGSSGNIVVFLLGKRSSIEVPMFRTSNASQHVGFTDIWQPTSIICKLETTITISFNRQTDSNISFIKFKKKIKREAYDL